MRCDRVTFWCLFLSLFLVAAQTTVWARGGDQLDKEPTESSAADPDADIPGEQEEDEEEPIEPRERLTLSATPLPSSFTFDGTVRGPAWRDAASIDNLTMIEPEEGGTPSGQTIVKVLVDANDIVIGVRCFDNDPAGPVSYSKARDSELEEEDHILIVLDTFMDGRSGYVFGINPTGARFDGLVTGRGDEANSNWDTIWEARTTSDADGWAAEVRIPIKSLSFGKGLTSWGFNVQRRVQRLQETSRWSGASQDFEIYQTSRAGVLTGLPAFDLGLGLSARPAVVSRLRQPGPGEDTESEFEFSLDATQKLGSNLLSSLTVNTDFAETEVDARQVNLSRFEIFFPEKRSFFLEGADIFDFGFGLDEDVLVPFFSRRIGLLDAEDQAAIPINVGGKINGRMGNTNLGALVVNTREESGIALSDELEIDLPNTTMGAMRVKQNILDESSVGMMATFGDQLDRRDAWSAGVDFTYQTSSFRDEKNLLAGIWGMVNDREDLVGDKSAWGFELAYPNDLFDIALRSVRIGDGFDPSLGFVPRNNVHVWDIGAEYSPRPPWEQVRQMKHELAFSLINDRGNKNWESYKVTITPLDWQLESGDQFDFTIEPEGDKPPEIFEIASSVDLPDGTYEWTRFVAGVKSARKRPVSGNVIWEFGDFYNGDLNTIEASLAFRPSAFLTVEVTAERNDGKLTALVDDFEELMTMETVSKDFTEELYGVRFQLNFTPNVQLSSFTQYETESRSLGSNNRLRWTFERVGDIFVVYNHNVERRLSDDTWVFVSNELPIKVQYNFRF